MLAQIDSEGFSTIARRSKRVTTDEMEDRDLQPQDASKKRKGSLPISPPRLRQLTEDATPALSLALKHSPPTGLSTPHPKQAPGRTTAPSRSRQTLAQRLKFWKKNQLRRLQATSSEDPISPTPRERDNFSLVLPESRGMQLVLCCRALHYHTDRHEVEIQLR